MVEGKLSGDFDFAGQLSGKWVAIKRRNDGSAINDPVQRLKSAREAFEREFERFARFTERAGSQPSLR